MTLGSGRRRCRKEEVPKEVEEGNGQASEFREMEEGGIPKKSERKEKGKKLEKSRTNWEGAHYKGV